MRRTITTPSRFIISTTSWLAKRAWSRSVPGFLIILLLLSCEDNTGVVGIRNPNRDFEVFSKEFSIPTRVFLMDSVSTSNSSLAESQETKRIMCGTMQDPRFGKTDAISYTQYWPPSTPPKISSAAVFQRLKLTLIYDYYWQGSASDAQQTYEVYEVTDSILTYLPHFSNQATPYGPLLGSAQRLVSPSDFDENYVANRDEDTSNNIMDSLTVELDLALGQRLLTAAMDTVGANELDYYRFNRFRRNFKGLAFVGENTDKIVGFNPNDLKSRMTLFYKVDTTEYQLTYVFTAPGSSDGLTQYVSYTQLINDRSGTPLAGLPPKYTDYEPEDGFRYVQNGTGVAVRLDLTEVRDHFKNIPVKALSVAELKIDTEEQPTTAVRFMLRALKPDNRTINASKNAMDGAGDPRLILDTDLISKHAVSQCLCTRLEPVGDDGRVFSLTQASNTSGSALYTGYLTNFLQQETTLGESDFLRYYALIPLEPDNGKGVNGFYFPADKVKLKVYYTTPGVKE